jgi:uncharacterized protein YjiS (DUF1127 family)
LTTGGGQIITTRTALGAADPGRRHIICPEPRDAETLYTWLHEYAHVKYQHRPRGAVYWQEYRASRFALEEMDRLEVPVDGALLAMIHNDVADPFNAAMAKARKRRRWAGLMRLLKVEGWLLGLRKRGGAPPA